MQDTVTVTMDRIHRDGDTDYFADASDLGMPPGMWPRFVRVDSGTYWSRLDAIRDGENDVVGFHYAGFRGVAGSTLTVWND